MDICIRWTSVKLHSRRAEIKLFDCLYIYFKSQHLLSQYLVWFIFFFVTESPSDFVSFKCLKKKKWVGVCRRKHFGLYDT